MDMEEQRVIDVFEQLDRELIDRKAFQRGT
jgi:hypothetical protein